MSDAPAEAASSSSPPPPAKKKAKKPFVDPKMKEVIKDNLRQVLGKLGNITEVIVQRNIELKGDNAPPPQIVEALQKAKDAFKKLEEK